MAGKARVCEMMVIVTKLHRRVWKMLSQRPRQIDARSLQRMVLARLHVIQFPCLKTRRQLPASVAEDATRCQPLHCARQSFVKRALPLPVAGNDKPAGIRAMFQQNLWQKERIVRLTVQRPLVLQGAFGCFGKKHLTLLVNQRQRRIVVGGAKPKVNCLAVGSGFHGSVERVRVYLVVRLAGQLGRACCSIHSESTALGFSRQS